MLSDREPFGPCREPLGISFTLPQAKTVVQWDRANRWLGVRARIALDHSAAEEVIEITHDPPRDPSWAIVRSPDGRLMVLDLLRERIEAFPTLQAAFRHVSGVLARSAEHG